MDPVLEAAGYIAGTELGGQSMQGCHGQGPGGMAIPTPNLLAIYASEHYVHVIDHHVLKETFSWAGTLGRHGGQWHVLPKLSQQTNRLCLYRRFTWPRSVMAPWMRAFRRCVSLLRVLHQMQLPWLYFQVQQCLTLRLLPPEGGSE